jgi:alkanesulfonate monooxygenase SsuD/methylene tetrahydromethanopterin reductase-like flavin-dependent oxidoreductase (luciferase family)
MKHGIVFPYGSARAAADMAHEAEQAGWDGFFVWEPVWGIDAWIQLAAAAMQTSRIRLGTMISPLSRMRPWDMAGRIATLDNLSDGRVTLAVGLGAIDTGFTQFGEVTDRKARAELLDESLDIITGLWRGQPFAYSGKHYTVQPCDFMPPPPPVQQPRVPIWVVGVWGKQKSMARVLKYDGWLPTTSTDAGAMQQGAPGQIAAFRAEHGGAHDIIVEGVTPGDDRGKAQDILAPWRAAGATWWIEANWNAMGDPAALLARVRQGPPGV